MLVISADPSSAAVVSVTRNQETAFVLKGWAGNSSRKVPAFQEPGRRRQRVCPRPRAFLWDLRIIAAPRSPFREPAVRENCGVSRGREQPDLSRQGPPRRTGCGVCRARVHLPRTLLFVHPLAVGVCGFFAYVEFLGSRPLGGRLRKPLVTSKHVERDSTFWVGRLRVCC